MFTFTVTRNTGDDVNLPITVGFSVGGTASYPTDYTVSGATSFSATAGSILIPSGQVAASFTATPVADSVPEFDETIVLTPQVQAGVFVVGSGSNWTATITNDDALLPGISFWLRATTGGFIDRKGSAISSSGATVSTTSRFGYSVLIQNGSISIPNPATLIPPTGDWTIDFWYQHISTSTYGGIFALDGQDYPLIIAGPGVIGPNMVAAIGTNSAWYENNISMGIPSTSQSDYYGLKREGGTISGWKNGTQISTFSVSSSLPIGIPSGNANLANNGSYGVNGYYEEFRISTFARDLSIVPTALDP
jgi:hypothetical protein